jgi:hypothetical protein
MPPYKIIASVRNLGKPFFLIKHFVFQRRINSSYLLDRKDATSIEPLKEELGGLRVWLVRLPSPIGLSDRNGSLKARRLVPPPLFLLLLPPARARAGGRKIVARGLVPSQSNLRSCEASWQAARCPAD